FCLHIRDHWPGASGQRLHENMLLVETETSNVLMSMKVSFPLLIAFTCFAGPDEASAQTSFALPINYPVGANPQSVTAADVNGDGKLDLICANWSDGTLSVLTNNGSGGFASSNATYTVGSYPTSVVAADVNGDRTVDLISANSGDNTLSVLTNNGSGGFV